MQLILYTKPGCHLCEGLHEKLEAIADLDFQLELRDITTRPEWFEVYQYEIPVLCLRRGDRELRLPRFSPRASAQQLSRQLQKHAERL